MKNKSVRTFKGASLIELAIGLLILSIAMIPIVLISTNVSGRATDKSNIISKEKSIASSLMEQATGNAPDFIATLEEYKVFNHNAGAPAIKTDIRRFPKSRIYYNWIFQNASQSVKNNDHILPEGNYLIDTTLQLYTEQSLKENITPSFILGTKIIVQREKQTFVPPKIGILFLLDMTPSMSMSDKGWGHNPLRIKDFAELTIPSQPERDDIPVFNKSTTPMEVLEYVNKWCMPEVTYTNNFGSPNLAYSNANDFIFLFPTDNKMTTFDETYIPSSNINSSSFYASPFSQEISKSTADIRFTELLSYETNPKDSIRNKTLSRIEMVRSSLYAMIDKLESEEAGPTYNFKIGIIPFTDKVDTTQGLNPKGPNKDGKFNQLKKYIKSINRANAPYHFSFKLPAQGDSSTNIKDAIQKAHNILKKDTSLTERIIVVVTDWNPCIEPPKYLDIEPCRNCIKEIVKELEKEKQEILNYLKAQKAKDPKYKEDPSDKYHIRLKEIEETTAWFLVLILPPPKMIANSPTQPYFPLIDLNTCVATEESPALSYVAKNVSSGEDGSDIYVFTIIDGDKKPSNQILSKLTKHSERGEYLSAHSITEIPELFSYMILELNRIIKIEESKRYAWNK